MDNIKKMINTLEECPDNRKPSPFYCMFAICSLYKGNCRACMFGNDNNSYRKDCSYTIGFFNEDSIYNIILNLKNILKQTEYKKFKSEVK